MPGLLAGVLAVSSAAVLIRLADAPALTVAAWRLTLASLVVVPAALALSWGRMPSVAHRDLALAGLAALFLALHFVAWIASLGRTSVASSVVLVTANPLLVAAVSHLTFRERVGPRVAGGIALGLTGGLVLGWGDLGLGGDELLGDGLALVGAAGAAGYWLVGRRVRQRVPLLPYVALVYSGAAVLLVAGALATGAPLVGLPVSTYGWLALVALVPQVMGHSLVNWALGRVSATVVSLAIMAEPVIATLLALAVLSEVPPWTSVVGGVVILAGVWMALQEGRKT